MWAFASDEWTIEDYGQNLEIFKKIPLNENLI